MDPFLTWLLIVFLLVVPLVAIYSGINLLFDGALKLYLLWRQFRAGARKRQVVLPDFTFTYLVHGEAQPGKPSVLLLHGFTAGKEEWTEVMRLLQPLGHVIAVDMPGHGETSRHPRGDHSIAGAVARVRQFIQALNLDKTGFHLVGSSWGGHIAGVYASKYPVGLHSVCLMCPAGCEPKNITRFVRALMEGRNMLLPTDSADFAEFLGCVFFRPPPLPRWALAIGLRDRVPHYPFFETVFDEMMEPEQRFVLQESMQDIHTPSLVLWGRHDQVLDPSGLDILVKGISQCEGHFLEECGHTISIEQPVPAARLIKDFILRHQKKRMDAAEIPNSIH